MMLFPDISVKAALTDLATSHVWFKMFTGRQNEFSGKEPLTFALCQNLFKRSLLSA